MYFYYNHLKYTSKLFRTPKAPKKINMRNYLKGVESARNNMPPKFCEKTAKMEVYNQDFIAGSNTAFSPKLEIIG